MRAEGSDRVRGGDEGQWIISSRYPKGWVARVPKTLTKPEHPGTAVLIDESYYEVIKAEPLDLGGYRYVLAPWADYHAIRVADRYDAETEAHRELEYRKALNREKGRKSANFFGIFTGLLPAVAQEQLASELGLLAPKLTLLSLTLPAIFIFVVIERYVNAVMTHTAPPADWVVFVAGYFAIESVSRFSIAWMQSRPIGSAVGLIVYSIAYLAGFRKLGAVSPVAVQKGTSIKTLPAPADIALRDSVSTRAPLMTLLSRVEQEWLAERYGYNYREHATNVALILLIFSILGAVNSFLKLAETGRISALVSLMVAAAVALEQIVRLNTFARRPAGSFLAFLVRPFVRKLLRG